MNNYDIIAQMASIASAKECEIEQLERDIKSQKGTIEILEHRKSLVKNNIAAMSLFLRDYDLTFLNDDSSIYDTMQMIQSKIKSQGKDIEEQSMIINGLTQDKKQLDSDQKFRAELHHIVHEAGYSKIVSFKDQIIALIGDRDMYSKDAEEWKDKASERNSELLLLMKTVKECLSAGLHNYNHIMKEYKKDRHARNGKGEK